MPRGVLRPAEAAERLAVYRQEPTADLARFVEHYWIVRWDLPGELPFEQTVLPHPNVHLAFEADRAEIHGVNRSLYTRRLSGMGKVIGVRFGPGGFRPYWGSPMRQLTDLIVPAVALFGADASRVQRLVMDPSAGNAEMVARAEELLLSRLPEPDPLAEQATALTGLITSDPALRSVAQLSAASGLSARSLQRLFAEYVGVTPKWVMRRIRLQEAAKRADSGSPPDWGQLAADLGYADQAHLTRDFTRTIGVSPTRYTALSAGTSGEVVNSARNRQQPE